MCIVYVTQTNAKVGLREGRFTVTSYKGEKLQSIPICSVERVVISAKVNCSGELIQYLLEQSIPVMHFKAGKFVGVLHGGSENSETILMQVQRWQDPEYRLHIASIIVEYKIFYQEQLLKRVSRNHSEINIKDTIDKIKSIRHNCRKATSLQSLMGFEGAAAKEYFSVFQQCLRQGTMVFNGRTRRPPLDPVNAMLSLGYTLLEGEVVVALLESGLHTGLGFLHEPAARKNALALDIMEFFRQDIVDRFVMKLINKQMVKIEDFYMDEEKGVRMVPECYRKFLRHFEECMTKNDSKGIFSRTYRQSIRSKIQSLKADMQQKIPLKYLPISW